MTRSKELNHHSNLSTADLKSLLSEGATGEAFRSVLQSVVQEILEEEMTGALQADRHERSSARLGYRSGSYGRKLVTRLGTLELRVPQDREGRFCTEVFERYQRCEKAFFAALCEMYVQGVSTRKVGKITEELCGHAFSASAISRINQKLDEELAAFAARELDQEFPYLVIDARYEKVRENGLIVSQAVLVAIGIDWDGRRQVLAVDMANRESKTSWSDFLAGLKGRGLKGVRFVVSDSHEGIRHAVSRILPEAAWQRCYVHFLRNALDYLPRKADDDCLTELRWLYDRRDLEEAQRDLSAWLARWGGKYPRLCVWAEENIGETFSFYRLPLAHHKHLKSTNMLERINQEIKRRTNIVRIFPNRESCLRLVRALCVEMHEEWLESSRYLNMQPLKDQLQGLSVLNNAAA
jgi:transposase-like protein